MVSNWFLRPQIDWHESAYPYPQGTRPSRSGCNRCVVRGGVAERTSLAAERTMSFNAILIAAGVCAGIALLVLLSVWSRSQALDALRRWAQAEGSVLVSARRRSFVPLWLVGRGCQFFRVTVRDSRGEIRRAWIRCLDFNSAEPHNLEVTWDERTSA